MNFTFLLHYEWIMFMICICLPSYLMNYIWGTTFIVIKMDKLFKAQTIFDDRLNLFCHVLNTVRNIFLKRYLKQKLWQNIWFLKPLFIISYHNIYL